MYTAKKSGKNKLAHYTDSSDDEAYRRLDMEKSMRAATATDSFLGLKFGAVFTATNLVEDSYEPSLMRASFTPKKQL